MDSILLFPPGASSVGSAIQLGSWLMADPGPDFGARGLIESIEAQNALRDGGAFAFRRAPIRKMTFPLVVNTPSVVNWEAQMARWTTPGAYIAVQPEGIPSSQAVYFDVIDGRWEPDYNLFENRAHVRKGNLHLDTQPWGYWPTEIVLASAASIGYLGVLAVPGGSVIGDVSPLARVQVCPTAASSFGANISGVDMVAISFAGQPSFVPFIPAGSWFPQTISFSGSPGGNSGGVLGADAFAPASQGIFWFATSAAGSGHPPWTLAAFCHIPSALEPAYRGRFRAFAFMKFMPAAAATVTLSAMLDAERSYQPSPFFALASANQLATIGGATNPVNTFSVASVYQTLDMGEVTLPAGGASGLQEQMRLRLWLTATTAAVYSATFAFAGVYLLPVEGAAGILARGGMVPSLGGTPVGGVGNATQAGFEWNSRFQDEVYLVNTAPGLAAPGAQPQLVADGRAFYRGVSPRVGASTNQLIILTADRQSGAAAAIPQMAYQGNVEYSKVSVTYRPQFQFLYGV